MKKFKFYFWKKIIMSKCRIYVFIFIYRWYKKCIFYSFRLQLKCQYQKYTFSINLGKFYKILNDISINLGKFY